MSKLEDKLLESINKPEQDKPRATKKPVAKKPTSNIGTTSAKLPKTNSMGHPRRIWPD